MSLDQTHTFKDYSDSTLVVETYGDGEPIVYTTVPGESGQGVDFDFMRRVILTRKQVKRLRRVLKADLEAAKASDAQE